MRLLFLSSAGGHNNRIIGFLIKDWYGEGKIGYIPSSPDPYGQIFQETKDWFCRQDPKRELKYLDIFDKSVRWWPDRLDEFSGFFINGGNASILHLGLQRSGMGQSLIQIAKDTEKPILGVDEGGMALTPEMGPTLKDVTRHEEGLHVVDFGFWPHYETSSSKSVDQFAAKSHLPDVYAVTDASGLKVEGNMITPIGHVYHFVQGRRDLERFTPAEVKG